MAERAARHEASRSNPVLPVPDLAEQYEVCLPEQSNASDLDRLLLCRGAGPFGVRAEHTWVGTKCPASIALRGFERARTYVYARSPSRVKPGRPSRRPPAPVEGDVVRDRV